MKIQQSAVEDALNDVMADVESCIEMLQMGLSNIEQESDDAWIIVVEAAYILCETIKKYANGIEEWQIWRFVIESECMPVTMEDYARDVLNRIESERRFKEYIERR